MKSSRKLLQKEQTVANDYVIPIEVTSPKRQWTLVTVIYDRGEGKAAVATGLWDGKPVLAIRWNGNGVSPIGNPQSRGLATWFIVPDEFRGAILDRLQILAPDKYPLAKEFIMNAVVLTNTIPLPDDRQKIQDAVIRGLGKYATRDLWTIKIFAPPDRAGYSIRIQAPNGYTWEDIFEGPYQETATFVEQKVSEADLHRKAGEFGAMKLVQFATADQVDREAMIVTQMNRM
jgi:hypothetical protein